MLFSEERHGPVVVLVPSRDLDLSTLSTIQRRIDALVASDVRVLLWDLGEVQLLTSGAVGFLLQAAGRLRAAGGRMALCRVGGLARGTLRTMGIDGLFATWPTREEALAHLGADDVDEG